MLTITKKNGIRVVIRQSWDKFVPGRGIMLQLNPHIFYFTFFLFTYMSCNHHVITYVTIVQVTYCPCDTIVPVTSIVLVTLLFLLLYCSCYSIVLGY